MNLFIEFAFNDSETMLNADKPFRHSIVQVLAHLSSGMVATSVTSPPSFVINQYHSDLDHNDPGKVVMTTSMQLSRGEPIYVDHNDPGKVVCQVSTVEGQWWAGQCK